MRKKFLKRVNKGDTFCVLLTDLSIAFSHELSIAKLDLYDFDMKLLNLRYDYLSKKKQSVIIIVTGGNYCMVLYWDQFWNHCYSLFFIY